MPFLIQSLKKCSLYLDQNQILSCVDSTANNGTRELVVLIQFIKENFRQRERSLGQALTLKKVWSRIYKNLKRNEIKKITKKQIADALYVSVKTIEKYAANFKKMKKLNIDGHFFADEQFVTQGVSVVYDLIKESESRMNQKAFTKDRFDENQPESAQEIQSIEEGSVSQHYNSTVPN